MPNALVSDVVALARTFLNDPATNGRWSNTAMIAFTERASKRFARDVLFPQARWVIPSVANQQEYQIEPAVIRLDRVYINGQPIVPADGGINTMEGHQIGLYDQTGTSGLPPSGGAGPGGATGVYGPVWTQTQPAVYPVANGALGYPTPTGVPMYAGHRPQYYWRGGVIGFVPAPGGAGETITLEGIASPPLLQNLTDYTVFPDLFVEALAWKVAELAKFGDADSPGAADARNYAAEQYMVEMRRFRTWNRRRDGDGPHGPKVRTNRSSYVRGQARW